MFQFIKNIISKKDRDKYLLKQMFSGYVSSDLIDEMCNDSKAIYHSKSEMKSIVYFLIMLEQNPNLQNNISILVDHASANKVLLNTILGPLVYLTIGTLNELDEDIHANMTSFIGNLPDCIKPVIKVLYGNESCYTGNIGNSQRMNYTSMLPEFSEKLKTLIDMEFGEIKNIEPTATTT